ncbi:SGNH/GDSL hydrolase family protein [Bacillus sp. USDA818B3_A]|uniref:SGNH/GDSL hydrolase family protein n=1 Tax=Bacillus sp. USDA818B3_A TaxID=2698834 RepID=UPI001370FBA3|nr:SGNH/GDSL hydrolase family protein [Bacillus sp. USDA818B3_A]
MKNKFLTILLGFLCAAVLYFGQSHWNQKIEAAPKKVSERIIDNQQKIPEEELLGHASQWPAAAVEQFKEKLEGKQTFKVLFVGSPAIGSEQVGTFPIVRDKLLQTFEQKNMQVSLKTYQMTSTQFIASHKQDEIAAEQADMIVLEPLIQLNNGEVLINKTLEDLTTLIQDIKAQNPKTTFIIQPSYPLYRAKIYPSQVESLRKFAEENHLTYLNHWTAWPDPNTDAFKEYLLPNMSAPSDKGYQVWSEYLINYFTNQKADSE